MPGETNINILLKAMTPILKDGEYVFCTLTEPLAIDHRQIIGMFKEPEGITIILEKKAADELNLSYSYIAAWITLSVHSSLEAVGLIASFSTALANEGISCNVVAAYYHDHIFVAREDALKAMRVLEKLSN